LAQYKVQYFKYIQEAVNADMMNMAELHHGVVGIVKIESDLAMMQHWT
jgi:hypothetical protein